MPNTTIAIEDVEQLYKNYFRRGSPVSKKLVEVVSLSLSGSEDNEAVLCMVEGWLLQHLLTVFHGWMNPLR